MRESRSPSTRGLSSPFSGTRLLVLREFIGCVTTDCSVEQWQFHLLNPISCLAVLCEAGEQERGGTSVAHGIQISAQ